MEGPIKNVMPIKSSNQTKTGQETKCVTVPHLMGWV